MEQLGIEPKLLAAQVINFFIILFVLQKLLYKPILGMLEKRKRTIEEGLVLTEKMRVEEEKMKQKQEKLLGAARSEAQKIIEEGKKQGKEAEKEILAEAHTAAQEVALRGRAEVDRLHKQMEKDIRVQAVQLAEAMTVRLTQGLVPAKDQHKIIADHIKKLEAMGGK